MTYHYLASPYTHRNASVMDDRYQQALAALEWLLAKRVWTYSPIVHCHPLAMQYNLPRDAQFWASYNRAMLVPAASLIVLCIDGTHISKGIDLERRIAHEEHIPLQWMHPAKDGYYLEKDKS